jgi:GT2 family glycosyltransferase
VAVARADRCLVVVPVLGQEALTHALLGDLRREAHLADVVVVDNGGDFRSVGDEQVLRPGSNLGWAAGTNLGTEQRHEGHAAVVWLNNDTRLSEGFVAGLLRAARETGAVVVAPTYDCFWAHQRPRREVPAARYRPRRGHHPTAFVDGTCMLVTAGTLDRIGTLDAEGFGSVGWGADLDYCFRARAAGIDVVVTARSYLNHEKSVTGRAVFGSIEGYAAAGHPALVEGLERKWGPGWRELAGIDPATGQTAAPRRRDRLRPNRASP